MSKFITYATEKKINQIKKINCFDRTLEQSVAVDVFEEVFRINDCMSFTLKEYENYLGYKIDNDITCEVVYRMGIHGLEYKTNGNVYYTNLNNLNHIHIYDFNKFVKEITIY